MRSGQLQFSNLDRIAQPDDRIEALRVIVTKDFLRIVKSSNPGVSANELPLLEIIRRTINDVAILRDRLITAEQSGFVRGSVDHLFRLINAILFLGVGAISTENPIRGEAILRLEDVEFEIRDLIAAYRELLAWMENWRLDFFRSKHLRESLAYLTPMERQRFSMACDETGALLKESFNPGPAGGGERIASKLSDQLDVVRELRTIAQAGNPNNSAKPQITKLASRPGLFLIELLPPNQHEFAIAEFSATHVRLRWDSQFTVLLDKVDRLLGQIDFDTRQMDHILSEIEVFQFGRAMRADKYAKNEFAFAQSQLVNLTSAQIPLDLVLARGVSDKIETGTILRPTVVDNRAISFWGEFTFSRSPKLTLDNENRIVLFNAKPVLKYPELPNGELRLRDYPVPLPFASYERWMLEDLARETGRLIESNRGPAATRAAFLSCDRSNARVLHITTHGFANGTDFELNNLMLSETNNQPTRIHFLDILSRDFSRVELVFLNTCLTQAGEKPVGESTLSLAWAFLAAGARGVIACRWQVEDLVAWHFARQFYRFWLIDHQGSTIQEAFHASRLAILNDNSFNRPSQWGAFVLLQS